jgi:hypothetical protein
MTQSALDYGSDFRVTEALRIVMRVVNDAVDAIGLHIAAGACGCRPPELADVLGGRSNRYLRVEWLLAIADISPVDFKVRIADALVNWMGMKATAARPLKPEERLAILEQRVAAKFGEAGLQLIEENRR